MQPAFSNLREYTVSEISSSLKRVVEDNFGHVRIRGEISGLKVAASGHAYLTLKDEEAVLDGVCWRGTFSRFSFKPEDGLEVVCTGRITTYPGRSKYQVVIEQMEPAGLGALMALLEKRKKQLEAEGLFAPERKQKLPYLPETIGVITSPTGAVIRDILHRLAERFPVHVIVWPVLVQGDGAAQQIADAINGFNSLPVSHDARSADRASHQLAKRRSMENSGEFSGSIQKPDLLIVARGGGSLEDLWAFNEEIVIRAAANSTIPLISAVGHETDTTLIDYVSDLRAPTPTAAAEFAVPVRAELLAQITETESRLRHGAVRLLTQKTEQVRGLARGLPPLGRLLEHAAQRLDDKAERLIAALPKLLTEKRQRLAITTAGLKPASLLRDVRQSNERVKELLTRLHALMGRTLTEEAKRLASLAQLLDAYSYEHVLARGFALVQNANGKLVTSAKQIQSGEALEIAFHDGKARTRAE